MKALLDFILKYCLDAAGNIALSILAIAAFLLSMFGGENAQAVVDRSDSAIGTVIVLVLVWTLLGSLTGALVKALKTLKENYDKNQVQQ